MDQSTTTPDQILLKYAQEAIQHIKQQQQQQCNLKSIYSYLKQNYSNYPLVDRLTEQDLIKQLELGVKTGILSRKFGAQSSATTTSPNKSYSIPSLNNEQTDKDKQDLNLILQLLIKTVALLNKQNFNNSKQETSNDSCTLDQICAHLVQNFKFNSKEESLEEHLRKVCGYLLNKQDKIFLKNKQDQVYHFQLNSTYVRQKLEQNLHLAKQQTANKIPSSELSTQVIEQTLGFTAPYNPEQILKIENLKMPSPVKSHSFSSSDCSSSPISNSDQCSFCLRPEKSNPLGQWDKFITCSDCGQSAHSYCLKYSPSLIEYLKTNPSVKWQCIECKKCSVCLQTCEALLLCDKCDRGYHKQCCQPALQKRPKGQFICHVCKFLEANPNTQIKQTRKKEENIY